MPEIWERAREALSTVSKYTKACPGADPFSRVRLKWADRKGRRAGGGGAQSLVFVDPLDEKGVSMNCFSGGGGRSKPVSNLIFFPGIAGTVMKPKRSMINE